ncbi:hypothetical protein [Kaarinaea lacus]
MSKSLIAALILIILVILLLLGYFTRNGEPQPDFSGNYCVTIEGMLPFPMRIEQTDSAVTFSLRAGSGETFQGTGGVSGQQMNLAATTPDGDLTIILTFAGDGMTFSGTYEMTGDHPQHGILTGVHGTCEIDLPDISQITASPTDTFVVALSELGNLVDGVAPMPGSNSTCYHNGAHVVFAQTSELETVDIIAPVDGIISLVDKCFVYADGLRDQYKIHMAYAQKNGDLFELELAIEPMAGHLCSNGSHDYYAPYIQVAVGDNVTKGQKIGEMLLVPGFQGHIHMNSRYQGNFLCPDIFNSTIIDTIDNYYNGVPDTCNGTPYGSIASGTICYAPGPGESHSDY